MFALYYYDLTELINPSTPNNTIKMFPLTISCVKQSCTFIKTREPNIPTAASDASHDPTSENNSDTPDVIIVPDESNAKSVSNPDESAYKLIVLCGDALSSGNFHAGIVLNKNLIAVNHICQLIDDYIDAYPKNDNNELNSNFLRLLFSTEIFLTSKQSKK